MKKIEKILIGILLIMNTGSVFSQTLSNGFQGNRPDPMQIDVQSQRIPAGKCMKIRVETPVNTLNSDEGDQFTSTLMEDIWVNNNVTLPSGTIIRGTVSRIKKSSLPSRSASLYLQFDHIVTPFGKQIPLYANVINYTDATLDGGLSKGTNYFDAVEEDFSGGVQLVKDITAYGIETGTSFWNGYPVIVTAPLGAFTGVAAGSSVFFGKSVIDLFKKGENYILSPGQIIEIQLTQPIDLPN